jgi:hypothetical protein
MIGFEAGVVFENAFHPPSKTSATGSTILAQTRFREAQKIKDDVLGELSAIQKLA